MTFARPDVRGHGFLGLTLWALDARRRLARLSVHRTFPFTTAREGPNGARSSDRNTSPSPDDFPIGRPGANGRTDTSSSRYAGSSAGWEALPPRGLRKHIDEPLAASL